MSGACSTHDEGEKCILVVMPEQKDPIGNVDVEGRIILKYMLGRQCWRMWIDSSGPGLGLVAGSC